MIPARLHRTAVLLLAAAAGLFFGAHAAIAAAIRHLAG